VIKIVIADTGAIDALIDDSDNFHSWAIEQARDLLPPFSTCEAVIAEASCLLKVIANGQQTLLAFIEQGFLRIDFLLATEIAEVEALMRKYRDVPMDLADACLVRMSEIIEGPTVFTLDSDF
jgi:predicted nucleic acid-binding protein